MLKKIMKFIKKEKQFEQEIESPVIKNNNFISAIKQDGQILNLQESFESGKIKEEDLTEDEKNKLIELYKKQINELKQDIKNYDIAIKVAREKLLISKRS